MTPKAMIEVMKPCSLRKADDRFWNLDLDLTKDLTSSVLKMAINVKGMSVRLKIATMSRIKMICLSLVQMRLDEVILVELYGRFSVVRLKSRFSELTSRRSTIMTVMMVEMTRLFLMNENRFW